MLTAGGVRQAIVDWRNWTLPVKLAAVVVVPVVFAVTLSAAQISGQVAQSNEYQQLGRVIDAIDTVQPVMAGLQQERNATAETLTGGQPAVPLTEQYASTDRATAALTGTFADSAQFGPVVAARYADVRTQLSYLAGLRNQVQAGQLDPASAVRMYDGTTQPLLALDQALTGVTGDPALSSLGSALHDLGAAEEEVRQQQAWMLLGLSDGSFSAEELSTLRDSAARMNADLDSYRAVVTPNQQAPLNSDLTAPEPVARNQLLTTAIARNPGPVGRSAQLGSATTWNADSDGTAKILDNEWHNLAGQLRQRATQLLDNSSNAAGMDSVVLLSALLLAAAVVITITRQLLRSLRQLRRSALDAAEHDLPAAVDSIRAGAAADASVSPVPVDTTEEVGQVARAFDEVNQQALRLAADQATLRRGFSESFVNASRRSQSLLERQLLLFEQLEQDEEDPDQLARLFQLDHLATRMRRNNENMMVLSGSDLARRFGQPTPLADVLRAAVSEIEQYPRVIVQTAPNVQVIGRVASDLVRLVAELLDNAANFSAPDTSVTVTSRREGDAILVEVLDRGIGMTREELTDANARLATASSAEWATSRRMGLLVAGRLAERHEIGVSLYGGRDMEGVRATVLIPPEHIASDAERPRTPATSSPGRNGAQRHDLPTSGSLPQRVPGQGHDTTPTPPAGQEMPAPMSSRDVPPVPSRDVPPVPSRDVPPMPSRDVPPVPSRDVPPMPSRDVPPVRNGNGTHDFPPVPSGNEPGARSDAEVDRARGLFEPLLSVEPGEAQGTYDFEPNWPAEEPEQPAAPSLVETSTQWFQPAFMDTEVPTHAQQPEYDDPAQRGDRALRSEVGAPWPSSDYAPQSSEPPSPMPTRRPGEAEQAQPAPSRTSSGLPRRSPTNPGGFSGPPAENTSDWDAAGQRDGGTWSFAMDDARQLAEAAASAAPTSYTPAGLPRRTPRAQLAPGSAPLPKRDGDEDNGDDQRFRRDPDNLRGRLADFQSGVRRGRHSATED